MTPRDDAVALREKIARAIASADGVSWGDGRITYRHVPEAENDRDGTALYYRMADRVLQAIEGEG